MKGWFNIPRVIDIMNHTNRLKDKNHMILSIDTEEVFDKSQYDFIIKVIEDHTSS